jgi:hypothetical protein
MRIRRWAIPAASGVVAALAMTAAAMGPPPPKVPTYVTVLLQNPTEDKEALAKEVKRVLEREQFENPGRQETFGAMALRGLTPQNERTHRLRLNAWLVRIGDVRRIPGGWQAEVFVHMWAARQTRYPITILNEHLETYTYRGGKLAVTAQTSGPPPPGAAPGYKPSQGLIEDPITSGLPEPPKIPPFTFQTLLRKDASPEERGLAKTVEEELSRHPPENPGREKTFGKMVMIRRPPYGEPHEWKMERLGWVLTVRGVDRLADGWRARVDVSIRARTVEGSDQLISTCHREVYRFRDGRMTLESDSVDPNYDPSFGLWPGGHHGWPDPEEGRPLSK